MRMLADVQSCGGYVRYLPVTKLDGETKKLALERFMVFRRDGAIRESGFHDDTWIVTDELKKHRFDFSIDNEAYDRNSMQWIGCTSGCYKECMKAYASMLLGGLGLETIRAIIKDLAGMAGSTAEEAVQGRKGNPFHRAAFLSMIPLGNDVRDHVIEELEDSGVQIRKGEARKLPEFRYYLSFGRLLQEYWAQADDAGKRFYFPVWFWWNLTAILPLRATEFLMTPWDCIAESGGGHILTVRRTRLKKGGRHCYKVSGDYEPCSYAVPQSISMEISWYKSAVGDKNTSGIGTLLVPEGDVPSGYFTYCQMQRRLKKFCREVLGDESYPIHLGDTRHLAMVNLILSGGSPVVCRELAGHEDIDISSHYYSNMSGVVESMILARFRGWDPSSGISGKNSYYPCLPEERVRVKDGWCDHISVAQGDVSECVRAYVPGGRIGDCLTCRHFYPDRKGLQIKIEKEAQKTVDDDGVYLMQMVELVRKSLGYEEDIDEALLRIQGSANRYGRLLARKYREGK